MAGGEVIPRGSWVHFRPGGDHRDLRRRYCTACAQKAARDDAARRHAG